MIKTEDQQKNNETINQIFFDIAQIVYSKLASNDNTSIKATIEFDDEQRVKSLKNLFADEKPRLLSTNDFVAINERSADILKLPEIYRVKMLFIEIKDGKINVEPTYLK